MMRTVLFSLAAAASALAVGSPASAQVAPQHYGYPAPPPYAYGAPAYGAPGYGAPGYGAPGYGAPGYGAPGYGFHHGHFRNLQLRLDGIQRQIRVLDRRNILSWREARRLREQSRSLERRLHRVAQQGLSPWAARDMEMRIALLEQRVHREAVDPNGGWRGHGYPAYAGNPGYPGYYGYGDRDDRRDRRDRDDD